MNKNKYFKKNLNLLFEHFEELKWSISGGDQKIDKEDKEDIEDFIQELKKIKTLATLILKKL